MSKDGVVSLSHQLGRGDDDLIEIEGRETASGRWEKDVLRLDSEVDRFEDAALVGHCVRDPDLSVHYELHLAGDQLIGTRNGKPIVLIPCS